MPIKELDVDLIPQLHRTDLRAKRRILSRVLEGAWVSILKGRGMEFAGFRQYTYGDDASRIDWNATLRAKETLVREFEEYKTVNVLFAIDVSDSMLFTSTPKLKCEYGAELVFNLATAITDTGNAVGYCVFSSSVIAKQYPSLGREVIYRMAIDLGKGENYGGQRDFKRSMNLIKGFITQRTLIILVSDFIDLPQGWERYIRFFAQENDLIGIMLRDPVDSRMPPLHAQTLVRSPSGKDLLLVDLHQYAEAYGREVAREEAYVSSVFKRARAGLLRIDTSKEMFDPIIDYFRKRTRILARER